MIVSSILITIILNIYIINADDCQYSTPNGTFDLRTFGYTDRPKFTDQPDTSSQVFLTYSFNGCFSYSTKDTCQNAAACATDKISKVSRLIARQADHTFLYNQGLITMNYNDGSGTLLTLFLLCNPVESFKATKNTDQSFLFYIESPCACPGKCTYKPPDKSPNGLAGGTVFLIILICVTATYLIGGVLFLRFVKHEQGVNLIPNRTVWLKIGSDSIGGVRYTWSKVMKQNTYDKV